MNPSIPFKKIYVTLLAAFVLAACNQPIPNNTKPDVLAKNMDTTLLPGEDIFQYANGGWIKNNPIPAEESQWGIGNLVIEENTKRLRTISENAAKENAANGSAAQKIGNFWQAAMDTLKIEAAGTTPLNTYINKIESINDTKSLLSVLAELDQIGVNGPIQFFVAQDAKQSDLNALQLWQTGIGLPEREYYFKSDSSTLNIRTAYVKNITQTLMLIGEDSLKAAKAATDILSLETSLAKAHKKLEDLRDPYANYLELLQWIIDDARFARWCGEKINNEMSSPIQLSVLGSLRYLGRGWTFDDIAKRFIVPCSMPSLILAVLPSIPGLYSFLCICLRLYPTCKNTKWQDFLDALD